MIIQMSPNVVISRPIVLDSRKLIVAGLSCLPTRLTPETSQTIVMLPQHPRHRARRLNVIMCLNVS